jgi:hypothetical protein
MKIEIGFSLIYTLCDLDPLYREYNIMANSTYTRNANIISTYFCVTYAVVIVNHISDVADNKFAESAAVLMLKDILIRI